MKLVPVLATTEIHLQLYLPLQFTLSRIQGIEKFFIAEPKTEEKRTRHLISISQYFTMLTRLYLFCKVQAVALLSVHLLMLRLNLLG